jgi:D-alanyl-D-alanine carboxypeptidase
MRFNHGFKLYWCAKMAIATWLLCVWPRVSVAEQGLSADKFAQLRQNIQSELDIRNQAAQSTGAKFPGATAALILPDGRVIGFATGYADLEQRTVMSIDARMPAGSVGKTFVAAVTLSLVADGKLQLDAHISRWLGDELWFKRLPNADTITLRHLLNHSSGLIDHVFDEQSSFASHLKQRAGSGVGLSGLDPREAIKFALDQQPLFPAGKGFHYADSGYILLGLIIEKAGGLDYYTQLNQRFLQPLDLRLTTAQNCRKFPGLAAGYAPRGKQLFGFPYKVAQDETFAFDPSLEWTGGGVVSNSQDLVRWARALFAGSAIDHWALDAMLNGVANPGQRDAAGRPYGYGLGVSIAQTPYGTVYRHGGFFPGYNSLLGWFPDAGVGVAMQINADNSNIEQHFDAMVNIIMQAEALSNENLE